MASKNKSKSRIESAVKFVDPPDSQIENRVLSELLNSESSSSACESASDLRIALSLLDSALVDLRTHVAILDTATSNYRSNVPVPVSSQSANGDETQSMLVRVLNEITNRISARNSELSAIYHSLDRL